MKSLLLMLLLLSTGLVAGCGASHEAAIGASYAAILEECDEREERIVREATSREEALEKLDLAMAYCDEQRRIFRQSQLQAAGVE